METLEPLSGPRTGAALRRAFTELFRVYVDAMCRAFEEHQTADGPFIETLGPFPSPPLPPQGPTPCVRVVGPHRVLRSTGPRTGSS